MNSIVSKIVDCLAVLVVGGASLRAQEPALDHAFDSALDNAVVHAVDTHSAAATSTWLAHASERIAAREYEISDASSGLQAPNRAQDLRTSFAPAAIELRPRSESATPAPWSVRIETDALRRGALQVELPEAELSHRGALVRMQRGPLVERYENRPEGLEQCFDIAERLPGRGLLEVRMRVAGASEIRVADGGLGLQFLDVDGVPLLSSSGLKVFDACGAELSAHFTAEPGAIAIAIDDAAATYPLLVDPLLTNPAWTAEGNQASAQFGFALATAGDINADGYSDVLVGAPFYDAGEADEGAVFVYFGSSAGLVAAPGWVGEGNQIGAWFGIALAAAGDVNKDGYGDVIVGASSYFGGQSKEGKAFVFLGSAAGLAASPAWSVEGNQTLAFLGSAVAGAGDVNNDGYDDVIVGAKSYDAGQTDEGRAQVYLGSAGGLALSPVWTGEGNQASASYGAAVATAGDVNADGFTDVLIGAPGFGGTSGGAAFVYHGGVSGPALAPNWTGSTAQASAQYGIAVSTAGDVNGDGYADVLIGASLYDNGQTNEGAAFVHLGSAGGASVAAAWSVEGNQTGAEFGQAVATAGDVNGDGYADVLVGAYKLDAGHVDEGKAYAYFGSASGLSTQPSWSAESDQDNAWFGWAVATAGDVNGDGLSDVLVGSYVYDAGQSDEGKAFAYVGSPSTLAATPAWMVEGNAVNAYLGSVVSSAGDVNGDGYSDLLVSAENGSARVYHGSAAGPLSVAAWTVTPAENAIAPGDVNADGYSDIVVLWWDGFTLQQDLYMGSPSGILGTPFNTMNAGPYAGLAGVTGDVNGDGYADFGVPGRLMLGSASGVPITVVASNAGDDAGAGDVNGDGFCDLVRQRTGDYFNPTCSISYGSPTGSFGGTYLLNETASIGRAAGDVNGDGFCDVLVWKPYLAQPVQGGAFSGVHLGSALGANSFATWIQTDTTSSSAGDLSEALSVGDVNGDGFSDLAVAFNNYFTPGPGFVSLYLGQATGVATQANWTDSTLQPSVGGQNGYAFSVGGGVASAGDTNGDGYGDVVVGSKGYNGGQANEGAVRVLYGNASAGLRRLPRQLRTNGSTPIALGGRSDAIDSFVLQSLGRSAAGRGRVRLEYEVKPLGSPFNGTSFVLSPWLDTGVPSAGGSAVTWAQSILGLNSATAFHWRVRARSSSPLFARSPWGSVPSAAITSTKLRTPGLPIQSVGISIQPSKSLFCQGEQATFQASIVGGTGPYQIDWIHDGSNLYGAYTTTLTYPSMNAGNTGAYQCKVTNSEGSVTSNSIIIQVNAGPPVFTTQPAGAQVTCGTSTTLSVVASGFQPTYQWRKNSAPIPNAISPTLLVTAAAPGYYDCVATNSCGSTTSQPALVSTAPLTLAMSQPYGPGSIRIQNSGAPPGALYFFVYSFDPMNGLAPGMGWWSGLWTSIYQISTCLSIPAPPFLGVVNGSGGSLFELPAGSLGGLTGVTLYGVTTLYNPAAGNNACGASNVASVQMQ